MTKGCRLQAVAAFTPSQKSVNTDGGSGDIIWTWVRRMPVTPRVGFVRHDVPEPPSQP